MDPAELEATCSKLGGVAARLSADEMLRLLGRGAMRISRGRVGCRGARPHGGDGRRQFVAASVVAERGATARLAHAFQALVPDTDRRRRLAAPGRRGSGESDADGEEQDFDELFGKVESMVSSVLGRRTTCPPEYGRELFAAQNRAVDVEQASDDPPERVAAWLSTVNDSALRGLDHQLLHDLLAIEDDPARWRDVADAAAAHADDLIRVGYLDQAWELADAIIGRPARGEGRVFSAAGARTVRPRVDDEARRRSPAKCRR